MILEPGTQMKLRLLFFASICVALAGCAENKFVGSPEVPLVDELPGPPQQVALEEFDVRVPYRFGARDKVRYSLLGLLRDESDAEVVVDTSGYISIPIAGPVKIGGLTPLEAEAAIVEALRQNHVRNPRVALNVSEINSVNVTVEGSVNEPGLYPVDNNTTLIKAIAAAKGLSEFAKQRQVTVLRTVNGRSYAALYDLGAIRAGVYRDPYLNPGDVVLVDESRSRRYFRDLLTAIPAISGPLIILLTR